MGKRYGTPCGILQVKRPPWGYSKRTGDFCQFGVSACEPCVTSKNLCADFNQFDTGCSHKNTSYYRTIIDGVQLHRLVILTICSFMVQSFLLFVVAWFSHSCYLCLTQLLLHVQQSPSNTATLFVKKMWPHQRGGLLARGRSKCIHGRSGKKSWPHQRGHPL